MLQGGEDIKNPIPTIGVDLQLAELQIGNTTMQLMIVSYLLVLF